MSKEMRSQKRGSLGAVLTLPAAVLPLLPSFTCPLCLAAYAGVLSTLGLGFVLTESVLAPLIVAFLLVGIASIAWTTRSHRRAGPLLTIVTGSAAVVAGRLVWNTPAVLYVGIALVIAASLWNLWLKRPVRRSRLQLRRGAIPSPESIEGEHL
ncbi:MAG: MerC domain-containing protein [Deltaproteobacteria bacterium]|nr:MerC domain-containing protein [Deltaproteobacteria bacterium]